METVLQALGLVCRAMLSWVATISGDVMCSHVDVEKSGERHPVELSDLLSGILMWFDEILQTFGVHYDS